MRAVTESWIRTPSGRLRARGLGLPFAGTPGPNNAITDVAGVTVGYTTLIKGEGKLQVGKGPVRTGVTAILPRGEESAHLPVWAGMFSFNGNGEMTGAHWIDEVGHCELAITITNTHSCGRARDATLRWAVARQKDKAAFEWGLPVAGETFDGYLSDINGFHVTEEHVIAAIESARGGHIEEGSVGGGTGMICYGYKGGSGSASRRLEVAGSSFTLGVFVQANFGRFAELAIAGARLAEVLPKAAWPNLAAEPGGSSIIAVVATDAPLLPHQLKRIARRVALGIGRSGTVGRHSSGDIFLAFSTANGEAVAASGLASFEALADSALDPLFEATVEASHEAILNALVANADMTGRDGHFVPALPHAALIEALKLKKG